MSAKISERRKFAFYFGRLLLVAGLISFLSVFVTGCENSGDFSKFESQSKAMGFRALFGMGLILVGGIVSNAGRFGLAGSGILLEPERARKDLEPFSRQAGGMAKDALQAAGRLEATAGDPIVKVRCRTCATLNPESAKFCMECGGDL